MNRLVRWAPVLIYMGAIFLLSADSDPPAPSAISDKTLHAIAYAGLAVLVFRAVAGGVAARMTARAAAVTLLITTGYGASDELHQMFVPGRSPELYDLFADAVGGALGLIACWAWAIIRPARPKSRISNPHSQR
jgi:VanZ family protein